MYTIVIGNKNYSSWSMRGWLAVKATGAPFEEVMLPLGTEEFTSRIGDFSPSRRVPALIDDDITIWDTMAIIDSLAERHKDIAFWPEDAAARGHARSACAEMHSGFSALRSACPMNFHREIKPVEMSEEINADVARIDQLWTEARERFGKSEFRSGPYLYGEWSAADIMFAPVVSRFRTYDIKVSETSAAYMEAAEAHPDYASWREDGLKETWFYGEDEVD